MTATPVYHSFTESNIVIVILVIPGGGGGESQCTGGPWIRNSDFKSSWGTDWFEYEIYNGDVSQTNFGGTHGMVDQFVTAGGPDFTGNGNEPQLLEQAIIIPGYPAFGLTFSARRTNRPGQGFLRIRFYLGQLLSPTSINIPPIGPQDPAPEWRDYELILFGIAMFRIEVSVDPNQSNPGQTKGVQIDNVVISSGLTAMGDR